jgi:ATP-dependent helicase YprA (DUF1998 family)
VPLPRLEFGYLLAVYPMNTLANSHEGIRKFLCHGYLDGNGPVTFARYTGEEREERRQHLIASSPDILMSTNRLWRPLLLPQA